MKPKLFLRIASGLILLHLILHSIGNSTWKQTNDPIKQNVISQMTDHKFPFMGTVRAMGDYFNGFGYITSIALALISLLLWILSGSSKENAGLTLKILVVVTVSLFVWAIDEFVFFFPFAACITLLAGLLSCIATLQLRQQQ
jgi:hypothetical protein